VLQQQITIVLVRRATLTGNNTTHIRVYRAKKRQNRMKTSFWMLD
jgi:hypothetical protein